MSTQLKEKQQTKSKEQVPNRELQADFHFNQHIFRTIAYTAAGFGFGMVSSLLFKHKAGMTIFFAGAGAGYGSADFVNELNNFRHKRNVTQINRREGGPSSQIREKLDRTADNLKGDFQQAKNKLERGTEDVAGKVAGQINQTARGAEEWARNASEKASQHFQKKDFRRGGDDDSDKDDTKSKKDQPQRKDQQKQDESLKRDQQKQATKEPERKDQKTPSKDQPKDSKTVDRQKEFKDQSHTSKKDEKQSKEPERKDQQKQASKDQPKDLKSKDSKTNEDRGKETEWNKTTKGGLSKEAEREAGSKEHRLKGDMRYDQFAAKAPDQEDFTGYNSPKQQWEGVKVKKEDKSTHGQGKGPSEENKTVNIKGQQFQDFHSNPNKLGASGETHEIKKDYQMNRNRAEEKDLDLENRIRYVKHSQQDRHGESIRQGNMHDVNMKSETRQGFQNYKTGVAPAKQTNESNAKL